MIEIDKLSPRSGRIVGEDGKVYNEVDILKTKGSEAQPVNEKTYDISQFSPRSGRIVGEDGKAYNEVDLLNGLTGKMEDIESEVTELSKLKNWLGETTTPITVGSTMNPITIDGVSVMANAGDVIAYDNGTTKNEFIFSEAGTWQVYDDKLDVYTKDETDELLDAKVDKVQGKGLSTNDFTNAYKNKVDSSEALLVDNAAKNLFAFTIDDLKSINTEERGYIWTDNSVYDEGSELTYTINADEAGRVESIVLNGTADTIAQFAFNDAPTLADKTYPAGDYIASVTPELPEGVYFRLLTPNGAENVTSEEEITFEQAAGIGFAIRVMEGTVLENVVFKPMFRRAGTNADFEVGYRTQKQLDAAVRELQKSSSEASAYMETVLYDGGTTATVGTVQLSQPITDFDAVTMVFGKPDGSNWVKNMFTYPTSTIPNGWTPEYGPIGLYVENDNITFGWNNGNQMYPLKVIGINYGGSVKGRNVTKLYEATGTTAPQTITLSQAYTDFDEIVLVRNWGNPSTIETKSLLTSEFAIGTSIGVENWAGDKTVEYIITSTTTLTLNISKKDGYIAKIYGIKYDSDYITIDSEMSATSENPVQNKVIKEYVDDLGLSVVNGQLCQTYNL